MERERERALPAWPEQRAQRPELQVSRQPGRQALQEPVSEALGTRATDPPWASERLLAVEERAIWFRPAWLANAQSPACAESQENVNFYQLGETVSTEDEAGLVVASRSCDFSSVLSF